jgi:Flp pilus assembly secretin CpaC
MKQIASVLACLVALAPLAGPARAQSGDVIRLDIASQSAQARSIAIPKGKSAMVELPMDARDVLVTNPQVADALLRSPRSISILGVARARPTRCSSTAPAGGSWRSASEWTRTTRPSARPSTASFPAPPCMWKA